MTRFIVFLSALIVLVSSVAVGYSFISRFNQGDKNRIQICRSENTIRKVLRDEHEKSLIRSQAYLKSHPRGSKDIPLKLIKEGIADERYVVSQVQPLDCK